MRFRNTERPENIVSGVLDRLDADTPTPGPSPQGGEAKMER
jgi:hypothetical protein